MKLRRSLSIPAAFTLIELLIVVAIIAILAAIAVPNFLEAQTRSKVTRVKADQRTIATAMEAYAVDCNKYPEQKSFIASTNGFLATVALTRLTTPVAYLTSTQATSDPFNKTEVVGYGTGLESGQPFLFANYDQFGGWVTGGGGSYNNSVDPRLLFNAWAVVSFGPDKLNGTFGNLPNSRALIQAPLVPRTFPGSLGQSTGGICWYDSAYDPTNGTLSKGDIGRAGGGIDGEVAPLFLK